jgi:tetratricopeptide (TPR) repeat protein
MPTNQPAAQDRETADSETVGKALEALKAGNLNRAEALLLGVIANTPAHWVHELEEPDGISIKFWDQAEFLHYVMWMKQIGQADKNIRWIANAYPQAHYYLGFLCVKRKQFERAIEFLDKGGRLEPTNPKLALEKAQALVQSGRRNEGLAIYDQVRELGPFVSAHDIALARRGRGFVLIEMGDLDGAEASLRSSLELEPESEVALGELKYIEHLRRGGTSAPSGAVDASGPDMSRCAACGEPFDEGRVIVANGSPVVICSRCERKFTKKWWQFWK